MKQYTSITISGLKFKIGWKEHIYVGDQECFGSSSLTQQKIYIQKNMPSDQTYETLTHEILHMAIQTSGIAELWAREGIKNVAEFEEIFIRILSPVIASAMKSLK